MFRRAALVLVIVVAGAVGAGRAGPPAGASTRVSVTGVTVTAARAHGASAVVLTFRNGSPGPVSLTSVTSSVASRSMIDFDDNMCQGNQMMTWLGNILVPARHTQLLGYRNQGAMLYQLRRDLVAGTTITLTLHWTNFSAPVTTVVRARVVAPPKGLRFLMAPMHM